RGVNRWSIGASCVKSCARELHPSLETEESERCQMLSLAARSGKSAGPQEPIRTFARERTASRSSTTRGLGDTSRRCVGAVCSPFPPPRQGSQEQRRRFLLLRP